MTSKSYPTVRVTVRDKYNALTNSVYVDYNGTMVKPVKLMGAVFADQIFKDGKVAYMRQANVYEFHGELYRLNVPVKNRLAKGFVPLKLSAGETYEPKESLTLPEGQNLIWKN